MGWQHAAYYLELGRMRSSVSFAGSAIAQSSYLIVIRPTDIFVCFFCPAHVIVGPDFFFPPHMQVEYE